MCWKELLVVVITVPPGLLVAADEVIE